MNYLLENLFYILLRKISTQKLDLIKICGHYVLTSPEFVDLGYRSSYLNNEIQQRVKAKLDELYK